MEVFFGSKKGFEVLNGKLGMGMFCFDFKEENIGKGDHKESVTDGIGGPLRTDAFEMGKPKELPS
ncbi:MAG: hypothetical protein HC892_21755 [Saprospiraceae bacterium]|nr:hypothetical protein [Saprospiraceae bacterium]